MKLIEWSSCLLSIFLIVACSVESEEEDELTISVGWAPDVSTAALTDLDCYSVTIQLLDSTGIPKSLSEDQMIQLAHDSSTGGFYSDQECQTRITSTTISNGQSSQTVFFQETAARSFTATLQEFPDDGWDDLTIEGYVSHSIVGTWKSSCYQGSEAKEVETIVYGSDDTFTSTTEEFISADCSGDAVTRQVSSGTYSLGDLSSGSYDTREVDLSISSFVMTALSDTAATNLSAGSVCGESSWTNGTEVNCISLLEGNTTFYSIYQTVGDTYKSGDHSTSESSRPTTLELSSYTRQ